MGLDFIEKAAKRFHKRLDGLRVQLGTPDLFTQEPECAPRSYVATILANQSLSCNEQLGVRLQGERISVLRGLDPVAEINTPVAELLEALKESHDEAYCKITAVHSCANTAELIIC